jgi:hypothetical protein
VSGNEAGNKFPAGFPLIWLSFGEAVMTNFTYRSPERASRFNGTVASLFMTAMVVLSGFLSMALFAG